MTITEFKSWFDGYTEDMEKAPTLKQWKRIKEMVRRIDGNPTTYPIFIREYWPYAPYVPCSHTTPNIVYDDITSSNSMEVMVTNGGYTSLQDFHTLGQFMAKGIEAHG